MLRVIIVFGLTPRLLGRSLRAVFMGDLSADPHRQSASMRVFIYVQNGKIRFVLPFYFFLFSQTVFDRFRLLAGVRTDEKKKIKTDDCCQICVSRIYRDQIASSERV